MKLRTRLSLNSVIILGMLLAMMLALYGSYLETSRANRNRILAAEMQQVAFERTVLRDEYLLTGSKHSTAEWKAETAGFETLLRRAEEAFMSPADRAILRDIRATYEQTASIYPQLVKMRESVASPHWASGSRSPDPREQALLGEIIQKASVLTGRISALRDAARKSWQDAYNRWIAFFLVFIGVAAAMIILNSFFINRSLARRIVTLREATGRISAGAFDQPLPLEGDDELTDLARATNEMGGHLQKSYTSIASLRREVTERKQAEDALRLAEERYRNIFDHAVEGIFQSTPEGRFLHVNPAYARIFGYDSPEEMIASVTDIGGQVYVDLEERRLALEILSRDGVLRDFECRARRKDGTVIWISIDSRYGKTPEGTPCYEGFVSDISSRKKVEASLRASEERYRTIIENIEDGYHEVDLAGRFTFFNGSFQKIMGFDAAELTGMHYRQYAADAGNAEKVYQAYNRVYRTGEALDRLEWDVIRKDGAVRTVEVSASLIRDAEGHPAGFRGIVRDVTDRRLAEEALQKSHRQLRALAGRLQEVQEETLTTTAYEIHDDLGGNLAALKMDLSHLEREAAEIADKAQRRAFQGEIRASKDLIDRSVFALRRIMMGLRPIILDDFGLAATIEWHLEEFTRHTGIGCDSRLDPVTNDLDRNVSTAVFRIFQEALANVARHAAATRVIVDLRLEAGAIVLEVGDNGRGITDPEKTGPRSLGILGMRERALAFGGELRIDGEAGKGTTLYLSLPASRENGPA